MNVGSFWITGNKIYCKESFKIPLWLCWSSILDFEVGSSAVLKWRSRMAFGWEVSSMRLLLAGMVSWGVYCSQYGYTVILP